MKKALSLVLVLIICFALVACGDEPTTDGTTTTTLYIAPTIEQGDEQTTTTNHYQGTEAATTVQNGGESTTTTTTKENTTTTTMKPTTTEREEEEESLVRGVSNKKRTEKVMVYEVDEDTYSIGEKKERTITYKGTIMLGIVRNEPYYQKAPFLMGVDSYINIINFDGGVGGDYNNGVQGYYIEVCDYNCMGDSSVAFPYTRKQVEDDKVFAIIGQGNSVVNDSIIDYVKQAGVIACYVASNAELYNPTADSIRDGAAIFPISPNCQAEGRITAGTLMKEHPEVKKVGIIYSSDSENVGFKDGAQAQVYGMGEGYECVLVNISSASDADLAVARVADCDAIIIATNSSEAVKVLENMLSSKVYKPVFMPNKLAQSAILTSIRYKYNALSAANKFPIYSNVWLSATDVDGYLEFAGDVMSFMGNNEAVSSTNAMYGWMAANVFCKGLERIAASGKEITVENYVKAMESAPIELPMSATLSGVTKLDYSYGVHVGALRMGVIKNNSTCDYFEEFKDMQDYIAFLQTGDPDYIK